MFYINVALYYCDHLKGVSCQDLVELQIVVVHLTDAGSSSSDKSPLYDFKSSKKEYSFKLQNCC
jgi:hypothetical protein